MAAHNAAIGVAYAAFFPQGDADRLGRLPQREGDRSFHVAEHGRGAIGPQVSLPLFDGGQSLSDLQQARASYNESVARYRSTVLNSVRDVEDALADLQFLAQDRTRRCANRSSRRGRRPTCRRSGSLSGETNYTDVIVADENAAGDGAQRARRCAASNFTPRCG